MHDNYYGVYIESLLIGDRWQWRITLPQGVSMTSPQLYSTAEQAVRHGRAWWGGKTTFNAIHRCLLEFQWVGIISHQEYRNFVQFLTQTVQQSQSIL
jgi:hypothetical protein